MKTLQNQSVKQTNKDWAIKSTSNEDILIENIDISDGGLLLAESDARGSYTLRNVYNKKATGKYFVLLWPGKAEETYTIKKLVWDNSNCKSQVLQGPYEALARFKCDDLLIIGGTYRGFIKDGAPYKQIMQFRHGKNFKIVKATFVDGWNDHGQQKSASPPFNGGYISTQRVGTVLYEECKFMTWAPGKSLHARQPGVDKIIYSNCIDPDGKKFSKTF